MKAGGIVFWTCNCRVPIKIPVMAAFDVAGVADALQVLGRYSPGWACAPQSVLRSTRGAHACNSMDILSCPQANR